MDKEASKIWKFLDTLSETDPVAYKNFLEEQRKEGHNTLQRFLLMQQLQQQQQQ